MSDNYPPPPPPSGSGGGQGGWGPPPGGGGYDAGGSGSYGSGGYGSAPPPPPGGYGYGGYGQPPQTDKKAVWSLVLGILGLACCGLFTGIPALILGKQSQKSIDASGGVLTGRGMATAGFVLGIISVVFSVISIILFATGALNFDFSTAP